jgi:hypothetical protein
MLMEQRTTSARGRRWLSRGLLAATTLGGFFLATAALSEVARSPHADLGRSRLVAETSTARARGDFIALYFAGRLPTQSSDHSRDFWTGDIRSLSTGEVVGTLRHEISCHEVTSFPCFVFTAVDTFTLPGGTIVNRATVSVAPDAANPGFFYHAGIHPEGKSIVSGTGIFAGRTGRAHMSARHDIREYPGHVTFDDFWLIELDPKA